MKDWTKPEPPPLATDTQEVWPLVIGDLQGMKYETDSSVNADDDLLEACRQRHQVGRQKYGTGLRVHNGRAPLRDLLDEALDACAYSRQQYEQSRLTVDWELHELAIQFAARVMWRIRRTA